MTLLRYHPVGRHCCIIGRRKVCALQNVHESPRLLLDFSCLLNLHGSGISQLNLLATVDKQIGLVNVDFKHHVISNLNLALMKPVHGHKEPSTESSTPSWTSQPAPAHAQGQDRLQDRLQVRLSQGKVCSAKHSGGIIPLLV